MAVVKIENGVVIQSWRDVETVADAVTKYGLNPADLVEGDHPPGTLYDGSSFSPPPLPPPPPPPPESPERRAIRALAAEIDAGTRGAVEAVETELGLTR